MAPHLSPLAVGVGHDLLTVAFRAKEGQRGRWLIALECALTRVEQPGRWIADGPALDG
ncbi:hypothetical protein [Streptomyces sp. NBC_00316]|uniref:hypothetical protein n=1 Tax=Streptomyces sp. NBC_00316 TaxID=2975710 RepID=UPI002E290E1F|nr:hypothetical protein [Streptomyces sp. NBC_00316]